MRPCNVWSRCDRGAAGLASQVVSTFSRFREGGLRRPHAARRVRVALPLHESYRQGDRELVKTYDAIALTRPPGRPYAGGDVFVQYNSPGNWYEVTLGAPAANGTYPISTVTLKKTIGGGPEGVIYGSSSNPQFANDSVLVSEYSLGDIASYEIDGNGDPDTATRRVFMTGLTGAEGAVIDPLTGDFLFSTFGGGNRVIVVKGFVPPPSTTIRRSRAYA